MNFNYLEKKIILITVFCVAFVTTNIVTVKILNLGFWGLTVPCGVIIYPVVFILTSVIADVYGERSAQKTIIFGVLCNLLFVVVSTIALILPAAPFWEGQASFAYIFSQTPRMLISSFTSYLIGNFVNAKLTTMIKDSSASGDAGYKAIVAIAIGEIVDNTIFITMAFAFEVDWYNIAIMIIVHFLIMFVWTFVAQPLTVRVAEWAKKGKGEAITC
ncbi:MAG: queuosine precursor transporter [Methanobrevibacter sp.]|nr:queuosine precursor transporter [Methanobrevibacter sp.]MDO5848596.1 queuosine precursor transporter [Methanobrevibacter sp.]